MVNLSRFKAIYGFNYHVNHYSVLLATHSSVKYSSESYISNEIVIMILVMTLSQMLSRGGLFVFIMLIFYISTFLSGPRLRIINPTANFWGQDLPPVRSKAKKDKPVEKKKTVGKRIKSSDYKSWDSFDAVSVFHFIILCNLNTFVKPF